MKNNTSKRTTLGSKKQSFVFVRKNRALYNFPKIGDVPPGLYKSVIKKVQIVETKSGKSAAEVCYDIVPYGDGTEISITEPIKMKQFYTLDTPYFDDFVKAMEDALGVTQGKEIPIENIVGVKELIFIKYRSEDGLGNIAERKPLGDSSDRNIDKASSNVVADSNLNIENRKRLIDVDYDYYEDDEDFLPEDED